jgi:hypothetical protein
MGGQASAQTHNIFANIAKGVLMKVNTESNHVYTMQRAQTSTDASANAGSFSSVLTAAITKTDAAKEVDFTSMTRKEMFDWMNDQIRSGEMSLDESSPFMGMTMKISAVTGQPVDMATDTTRINFVEKARSGIEAARANNDLDLAKALQASLETMLRQQV